MKFYPPYVPPATTQEAEISSADVVVTDPAVLRVVGESWRQNPDESLYPNAPKRRKGKAWSADERPGELYAGHENLLVRTQLNRAPGYSEKTAPVIAGPDDLYRLVKHLGDADNEHMVVITLSRINRVTAIYEAAIGGLGSVQVEMRQLVKIAILTASTTCIMVHNHPSGSLVPSADDIAMTNATKTALLCLGISIVDHLIVTHHGYTSFRNMGLL